MGFLGMAPCKVHIRRVLTNNTYKEIFQVRSERFRGYGSLTARTRYLIILIEYRTYMIYILSAPAP